jgi:hypothetical protein
MDRVARPMLAPVAPAMRDQAGRVATVLVDPATPALVAPRTMARAAQPTMAPGVPATRVQAVLATRAPVELESAALRCVDDSSAHGRGW